MTRTLDLDARMDALVDATSWLVTEKGVEALTLQGIARESRNGGATLVPQLDTRERLLRVVASVFAARRTRDRGAAARDARVDGVV